MTKKKIATFTTVTDYRQEFEICLNDIWDDYIADQEKAFNEPFDDEEKDHLFIVINYKIHEAQDLEILVLARGLGERVVLSKLGSAKNGNKHELANDLMDQHYDDLLVMTNWKLDTNQESIYSHQRVGRNKKKQNEAKLRALATAQGGEEVGGAGGAQVGGSAGCCRRYEFRQAGSCCWRPCHI